MYYIQVQQVDYDDYPIGGPTNVGPFETREEAGSFMENSHRFKHVDLNGYKYWELADKPWSHTTVNVWPVDRLLTNPDSYNKRGY
jgi:starvation-inducible outer membrane lipoprotein